MLVCLLLNVVLIVSELYVLSKLKNKKDILKYYTYLQNFICLIVSIIFCIFVVGNMIFNLVIPEYVRGLRYVVSTSLLFTMLIYVLLLSGNKNNLISNKDFKGISGKKANMILHYICPLISLVSFIVFERSIVVSNGIWTMLVAIPSCLYWIIYLILSSLKLWKEPYEFSKSKNKIYDILLFIGIPISFILISFVLWNIR